ncbi:MAG: hypothetical protein O7A04_03115, partial [Acidobacteria bacterium]|nr:hypothetical protein [Acidobacteriota bacterium]
VMDLAPRARRHGGEAFEAKSQALYCSHHTTAGFLDRHLGRHLRHRGDLFDFIGAFQRLFPANADYEHDKLYLRTELSDEQRRTEPRNADSHLTFIGAGMHNCVTYPTAHEHPVYLVDLDGVHEHGARRRKASIVAYREDETVAHAEFEIPVSNHPVDSINIFEPEFGLVEELGELIARHGVEKGRLDISLADDERDASLTVNEYETLLMQHDLRDVLRDPLRFMREKGRNMLRNPRAVPIKSLNYAQYDLVHILNELMEAVGVSESILERLLARLIALPASRLLGVRRSISLMVSDDGNGKGTIIKGTYQSPILMQWRKPANSRRRLTASLVSFR